MSNGETFIYQDQLVTITNARAIMGGTTYAMANITSVRHTTEPAKIGCLVLMTFLAATVAIISFFGSGNVGVGFVALLIAAAVGAAAYSGRRSKHWINIGTAGAEQRAIFSYDEGWTKTVVAALNNAIISRG